MALGVVFVHVIRYFLCRVYQYKFTVFIPGAAKGDVQTPLVKTSSLPPKMFIDPWQLLSWQHFDSSSP